MRATLWLALTSTMALGAMCLSSPSYGQGAVAGAGTSDTLITQCATTPRAQAPSADQQRLARDLVARAQEASIVADNATARELYQRAAQLDPTNTSAVYALARAYETENDARAVTQYCLFLSLAPNSGEAADVRQRIAAVSSALAQRRAVVRAARVRPELSPTAALELGLIFPGLGQYSTHRFAGGILATALAAGGVYYAARSTSKQVTLTANDPFGNPYTYSAQQTEHPNLAVGLGAAAGVSLIAAIEAYVHARGVRAGESSMSASSDARDRPDGASPTVLAFGKAIGLGLQIPLALQR